MAGCLTLLPENAVVKVRILCLNSDYNANGTANI